MTRWLYPVGTALLWLTATTASSAQKPSDRTIDDRSIDVGGISLKIGMPQAETLARLATLYDVRHHDNAPGTWTVSTKTGTAPHELLGSLSFRDLKLAFVSKFWSHDRTPSGLASAIYSAFNTFNAGQRRTCGVETGATDSAAVVVTTITCGRRRFEILAGPGGGADVTEAVSDSW